MLVRLEGAKSAEPERPPGLPESGFWNPSVGKWEVPPRGANGAREGERLLYRPDGSLFLRMRLVAGVADGPFAIYHPDGAVAREGVYAAGVLDGLVTTYAPNDPGGEPLRSCCVPPGAARLCERYQAGDFLVETFYDEAGRALLSDGGPCPPRPASLPELAGYDEGRKGWALHTRQLDRYWTLDGTLLEEVERAPDGGRIVRVFDDRGQVCEESGFSPDGRRRGPFLRRLAPGAPAPTADARVREERGHCELGQAVGVWTFRDAAGAVVRQVNRGLPFVATPNGVSPAFADKVEDGWALANRLLAERRVREALCAAARAAVRGANRAALIRSLAEHLVPLAPEIEAERGDALSHAGGADVAAVLDELMLGTDAAAVFCALAGVLPGTSQAAADFVEASLLLAPERGLTHLARALVRVERGDESGAHAALAAVGAESAEAADSLRTCIRLVFRPCAFSPAEELPPAREAGAVVPEPGDAPGAVAQSLEAVRHLAGVYATRLLRARAGLRALLAAGVQASGEPAWLPPDVSPLLPAGPFPLRHQTIACDPEEGAGGEPETIEIDERIATEGLGVPALLALAQADYGALSWLCWSAGLHEVAMPGAIAPPAELAAAVKMIVQRDWRAHDRLATGGLLAMKHGVPSFAWRGVDIELLPRQLVETAAAEVRAVRSMFLWLGSPEALSPFQDDIRDA